MSKKETKLRTSITLAPGLLAKLRSHCTMTDISVSQFIEDCVAEKLEYTPEPAAETPKSEE